MKNTRIATLKHVVNNIYQHHHNKNTGKEKHDWIISTDIFYLLNTLKIHTETKFGEVTIEPINKHCIHKCLEKIQTLQSNTDERTSPITITVCGATLEKRSQENRLRAIPKAAGIRFFAEQTDHSDAYFYHGSDVRLDSVPSNLFTDRAAANAKNIGSISINDFIALLEQNNAEVEEKLFLRRENFAEIFSKNEHKAFAQLSEKIASLDYPNSPDKC